MCRRFNDGMAADAKASNGRLIPLVAVPPFGTKANLEELDLQARRWFCGRAALRSLRQALSRRPGLLELFEHLNERHVTVYVHHVPVPVENESLLAYDNLRRSYGRCVDQTTAIGRRSLVISLSAIPISRWSTPCSAAHTLRSRRCCCLMVPKRPDASGRFQVDTETVSRHLEEQHLFRHVPCPALGQDTPRLRG